MMFLTSALSGLGQALISVVQGEYIALCATESTKGFYFGYFWLIYMQSQIIGNYVGAVIILKTDGPEFYMIMFAIMLVACYLYTFIKLPTKIEDDEMVKCNDLGEYLNRESERPAVT